MVSRLIARAAFRAAGRAQTRRGQHAEVPPESAAPPCGGMLTTVEPVDEAFGTLARVQRLTHRHRELIKFAIVGATTFVIDSGIFYILKWTVLAEKPVTAKIISGVIAVIASYILHREWSFKNRGGREKHHEALLFFLVSGVGVILSFLPLYISSYVFHLRQPHVSFTVENIADFCSAYVIGNLLQMAFRFWAMRRWVFPTEMDQIMEELEDLVEETPRRKSFPQRVRID